MPKILIVEDEPDILDVLQFTIENAGYQTITARNGKEGLQKALSVLPDLIITDVIMPVMGGYEFFKKLKENKATAIIPVLVITARGAMEEAFRVIGADAFLTKPFEDYVLLSKVAHLLGRPNVLSPPPLPEQTQWTRKVLVACSYPEVAGEIVERLTEKRYQVKSTLSGADVISRTIIFEPDILIMNIQLTGEPTVPQIIKIIYLVPKFKRLPILVYSYYRIAELGSQSLHEKAMDVDACQRECIKAGASEYLGRYNEITFVDKLLKYLP